MTTTTENQSATFDMRPLIGISICATTKDVRYYLNGVHVLFKHDGVRITATTGYYLATWFEECEHSFEPDTSIIIPIDKIKALPKPRRTAVGNIGVISRVDDKWSMEMHDMTVAFEPVNGKFPDFAPIINDRLLIVRRGEANKKAADYNPMYLYTIVKAIRMCCGDTTECGVMYQLGDSGAIVLPEDISVVSFIGVLMPYCPNERENFPADV